MRLQKKSAGTLEGGTARFLQVLLVYILNGRMKFLSFSSSIPLVALPGDVSGRAFNI